MSQFVAGPGLVAGAVGYWQFYLFRPAATLGVAPFRQWTLFWRCAWELCFGTVLRFRVCCMGVIHDVPYLALRLRLTGHWYQAGTGLTSIALAAGVAEAGGATRLRWRDHISRRGACWRGPVGAVWMAGSSDHGPHVKA
jgi:hypothetical protein